MHTFAAHLVKLIVLQFYEKLKVALGFNFINIIRSPTFKHVKMTYLRYFLPHKLLHIKY